MYNNYFNVTYIFNLVYIIFKINIYYILYYNLIYIILYTKINNTGHIFM